MGHFQRISDPCSIVVSREFGYAVLGTLFGVLSSFIDFGFGIVYRDVSIWSLSGGMGLVFSFLALFVASDYIRERDFKGKALIFCSAGIFVSLCIFGRPGFFSMTQHGTLVRTITIIPLLSALFLLVSGGKFLRRI